MKYKDYTQKGKKTYAVINFILDNCLCSQRFQKIKNQWQY